MTAQLHQAYGIVQGRLPVEDRALLRTVELERKRVRRVRRGLRRTA